jgi:hypothetical protein
MTDPGSEQATTGPATTNLPDVVPAVARPGEPAFAHASEAEMARILDFYAVEWEYEPHRFPILWNLEGTVIESFSPDFYLPDLDLYLEMTTLRQRLVRKKNRKLRRLRELYPDVRIKLFYARDFRALMLKYGKLALIGALSGTSGQVGPVRGVAVVLDPADPDPVLDAAILDEVAAEASPMPDSSPVQARLEAAGAATVPVTPSSTSSARAARRGREDGARRPARRPARPERPGSGR